MIAREHHAERLNCSLFWHLSFFEEFTQKNTDFFFLYHLKMNYVGALLY